MLYGPTFAEMHDPSVLDPALRRRAIDALERAPLDPVNLYNITWKSPGGDVEHLLLPRALTGVDANIIVISGGRFPSGSHKVGAVYSILIEKQLAGEARPGEHTLVLPSTGNYGIGGAWVGPRMGYRSLVVLPEDMSAERFEKIRGYGAEVNATPGSESNVKEIFDRVWQLRREPMNRVLEQFSEFGNYRFHTRVTGESVVDLVKVLGQRGIGDGRVAAFVSAMGSAGTIGAGDRIKQRFPACAVVGLEPRQCPTLYNAGFGSHRIEGIGDKHVTWIHNVMNMDLLFCIDDLECLLGLQLLQEGAETLVRELRIADADAQALVGYFGVSGICNVLGAIKTARLLGLGTGSNVVTVATDRFDRYPSVLRRLTKENGTMTPDEARKRLKIFQQPKLDWALEGTRPVQQRWHNQKYFTWVEQQGKTVDQLNALASADFWAEQEGITDDIDRRIRQARP